MCTWGTIKVIYSCVSQLVSIAKQLKKISGLCNGKKNCDIDASREIFEDDECPGMPDEEMQLKVSYRCEGGEDSTYVNKDAKQSK